MRYKSQEYLDAMKDDEQENVETENENQETVQENNENLSDEESTFKKRYSDLRSHSSKVENNLKSEVQALKDQVKQLSQKEVKLPKSEEELKVWAEKYPDVAAIVESIAIKKAKEISSQFEDRVKRVDQIETQMNIDKALSIIREAHPDFDEIREDKGFHEKWVPAQSAWVRKALYENTSDPQSVIDVLDLYKSRDTERSRAKAQKEKKDAASSVTKPIGSSPKPDSEILFRESDVKKMSDTEYERNEDKIAQAMREGKFEYDLTGGAR